MTDTSAAGAPVSRVLSAFLAQFPLQDVPPEVLHEAKRSLLNILATALAGYCDPMVEHALGVLRPFAGAPGAQLIGRAERIDALNAAFLNAAAANVHDYDDTHPGTVMHPTAPVAPALLALAETRPLSGHDLLAALAMGMETECRIGNAVSPGHYRLGWHITATCGVFGAAAAVGKCLGLDETRMLWALGNASVQSCGLVEALGTMAKSLGVGDAARNGLLSALGAQAGIEGPDLPLEGPRGFFKVMGGQEPLPEEITDRLGERWEMRRNTYKLYPGGIVLHAVIDACLDLRSAPGFTHDGITEIVVRSHPLLRQRTDRPNVTSGRESQVSVQHCAAVVLIQGAASLAQFTDQAVADPAVQALRRKVRVEDADMPVEAAEVTIAFADGRTLVQHVACARGGEKRPLSDAEIADKVRALAAYGGSGLDPEPLIAAVWALDAAPDAGALARLAAGRVGASR